MHYFEHKRQQAQAAKKVILEVAEEFYKLTGRKYGFFEEYKTDDADVAIVAKENLEYSDLSLLMNCYGQG